VLFVEAAGLVGPKHAHYRGGSITCRPYKKNYFVATHVFLSSVRYRYHLRLRQRRLRIGIGNRWRVLFILLTFMLFDWASAATAEPDAAGDVAAGKAEVWASCHAQICCAIYRPDFYLATGLATQGLAGKAEASTLPLYLATGLALASPTGYRLLADGLYRAIGIIIYLAKPCVVVRCKD